MPKIREITVDVSFWDAEEKLLATQTVSIDIEPGQQIRVQRLVDALQRSVAHCVDALQKDENISREIIDNRKNM